MRPAFRRGYSLVMWSITFGALIAALFFIRPFVERALRVKIYTTTDHFLWGVWPNQKYEYKGEKNVLSKSRSQTDQVMETGEADAGKSFLYVGPKNSQTPTTSTNSSYMTVEEGAENLLNETHIQDVEPDGW